VENSSDRNQFKLIKKLKIIQNRRKESKTRTKKCTEQCVYKGNNGKCFSSSGKQKLNELNFQADEGVGKN